MENNIKKEGINKLFVIIPIVIALVIGIFFAIKNINPNGNMTSIAIKQEGVYANYISAAKDYYEKLHGKTNQFRYGNVISEYMNTRDEMAQANSTVPILKYVVLLVYEEEGKLVARNYLCEVTKGEFEKIVKRNTPKETNFIESAVNASDRVTKNRSKTGSIEFDIKTGEIELTPAVKIGAFGLKTDIGKIYDTLGDTYIGSAAGIEEVFNQIRNSDIKENKIVEKMTDAAYFYAVAYYSRFIYADKGINVKSLTKEEIFNSYFDDKEKELYEKLITDNQWVFATTNDSDNTESKYDKFLTDNGIVKNNKNGYSSHYNKNIYFKNYKIEIPEYYKKFKNDLNEVGYSTDYNNKNDTILMVLNDKLDVGNVQTIDGNAVEKLLNRTISSLNGNQKFELDTEKRVTTDYDVNGRLYSLMSKDFYSETFTFNDYTENMNIYIVFLEYLNGAVEYKNDFKEVYTNIRRIKDDIKIDAKKVILKDNKGDLITNVEDYFKNAGFTNIILRPKYDAISSGWANVGSFITGGQIPATKDNVYDIQISGRDFDGSQTYRENDKIEIFYHDDKNNKTDNVANEYEEDEIEIQTPNLNVELIDKQIEKENRLNNKQTLSLEEIDKVKLVTEYSDDAVIDEIDTIKFGKYPQDSRDKDDKQEIEWIVLDRKDGKALLLSKYILDCKKYDDKTNINQLYEKKEMLVDELGSEHWDKAIENYKQEIQGIADTIYFNDDIFNSEVEIKFYEEVASYLKNQSDEELKEYIEKLEELIDIEKTIISEEDNYKITWGECTLRKWLNEDFVYVAFTDSENNQIAESNIKNFDNFKYKTKGGEDTLDKIFCLSIDEVEKYFGDNGDKANNRVATSGTKYAKMVDNDGHNLYVTDEDGYEGCSPYWLRSPGEEAAKVSVVNRSGAIVNGVIAENELCGVRPAMWVSY